MATLRLVPASGAPIEVERDKSVVGRDAGCDVVVNDVSVSRKHARLEIWGGDWAVVDQKSANGTFVNGERVTDTKLKAGQELRFGAIAFRVEIEEQNTGATVLMSMPTDATVLQPAGLAPRAPAPAPKPAPVRPAPPPPPPAPAPRPVPVPAHAPAHAPAPAAYVPPPEPEKKGRGIVFWGAMGCGGVLLLALLGVGGMLGFASFKSREVVAAANAQIADMKNGDVHSAYGRTSASYQAAHPEEAFAAFVSRHPGLRGNTATSFSKTAIENDTAVLTGTLTHSSGAEEAVFRLAKEGDQWRVTGIDVGGDEGASVAAPDDGLRVDIIAVNKAPQGQATSVKIDIRVTGFDLRPEGQAFRLNLVEDLETFGPDGRRLDGLSRVGLETFNRTTASATDPTATFNTALTFAKPEPGKYRAVVTIRDLIGNKTKKQEVSFDLP